jgi:hypothetical protein
MALTLPSSVARRKDEGAISKEFPMVVDSLSHPE